MGVKRGLKHKASVDPVMAQGAGKGGEETPEQEDETERGRESTRNKEKKVLWRRQRGRKSKHWGL